jgi:hypothetical protein
MAVEIINTRKMLASTNPALALLFIIQIHRAKLRNA